MMLDDLERSYLRELTCIEFILMFSTMLKDEDDFKIIKWKMI